MARRTSAFRVRPDERCQRGLTFIYETFAPLDGARLLMNLQRAYDGALIIGEERLGRAAHRKAVLQFRFEVRLQGGRAARFMFRASSSALSRAHDQAAFERALAAVLTSAA